MFTVIIYRFGILCRYYSLYVYYVTGRLWTNITHLLYMYILHLHCMLLIVVLIAYSLDYITNLIELH